ncbi:hypothetical protein [Tessaracoccus sp. ZS01]|uniref:hypothetical protein n=1 Tax=Tessaracoccus sp. ZS01 TaxID=1906324 RepID=UPI00096EE445|nr:hypothetical protein [Tessaracoccus sp. ZS01]MCG6566512.1 hypothetical protein [Tessaracoccus sp. ZS01]OMG58952.1 hypothetical protein BJN44_02560 [Tessaracoccus sp. ZS01]
MKDRLREGVKVTVWIALGVAVAFVGVQVWNSYTQSALDTRSEVLSSQVINAISREEQVSLLSLGIQGIAEKNERRTIFGIDVPGSERALCLQYNFNAKLGIDGGDVRIEKTSEDSFTVSIPEFIFIGHNDANFKLVTENSGVLSWVTPEIDAVEMTNQILNDEAQSQYIDANEDLLRDQAEAFYEGIITAIDPSLEVEFEYASGR